MRIRKIVAAVAISAAAALATGCSAKSSSLEANAPALKASASALASVPGADAKQVLISKGVPINGTSTQQILWAKSMAVKANREALYKNLAIPTQNKTALDAAILSAAKTDHILKIGNHVGRVKFFDTDLPNAYTAALVVKA